MVILSAICEQTNVINAVSIRKQYESECAQSFDDYIRIQEAVYLVSEERAAKMSIFTVSSLDVVCSRALCAFTYCAVKYILALPDSSFIDVLKKRAVHALCSVFSGCPRLMIVAQNEVGIIC